MTDYKCEKCGKVFEKKNGYTLHLARKTPCVKEVAKEETKAPIKKVVKTPIKKEPIKEVVKEDIKAPIKEMVKEETKAPIKEVVKEDVKVPKKKEMTDAEKEEINQTMKKDIKEIAKEIKKTLKQDMKEEIRQTMKNEIGRGARDRSKANAEDETDPTRTPKYNYPTGDPNRPQRTMKQIFFEKERPEDAQKIIEIKKKKVEDCTNEELLIRFPKIDYDEVCGSDENFLKTILEQYTNNTLVEFLGDLIVRYYKDDPNVIEYMRRCP